MEPSVLEDILDGQQEPTNLPFSLLENITRGFSKNREIGHGGFGTVYKGLLANGIVAVKRIMSRHTIEEKPFQREVNNLLEVNHPNVVRFLGYCASTEQKVIQHEGSPNPIYAEIRERLLCFEYISNGSLHKYITDELRGLEWDTRYQIIRGVCEGLYYLHTEKHIIHMDLKPDNVLLDNHMIPKITDFGLSRPDAKSMTMSTDRYASLGYCAPEYLHHGTTSVKCDVYSLGVIIMELVTGRKGFSDYNNVLRRWRHRWNKSLKETPLAYQQQVFNCIKIGLLCLNDDPSKRPSVEDIIHVMDTIEGSNEKISNANESILGQISSCASDDMLDIEPVNLCFRSELNNQMSCSLLLTNETDSSVAFNFESSPLPFCTQPNRGIVPPQSKCSVNITLQSKQKAPQHAGEFTVQSTKVNGCLAAEDITRDMFKKGTSKVVDEVNLEVAFDSQLPSELLDVHPLVLLFPFTPKKITSCSLLLTNNTDEMVVFNLKSKEWFNPLRLPRSGVVPPRSTYTLVVITEEMKDLPEEREVDLILQHCITHDAYASGCIMEGICKQHIKEAKQLGDTVHKMRLKAVFTPQEKTAFEAIPPSIEITSPKVSLFTQCQDSHQTEPWIITGYSRGEISLWDYKRQKLMGVAVSSSIVRCVQFVERKLWVLAGTADGCIHVYDCKTMQNINSFRAHDCDNNLRFISLAVHPTRPYVLSSYNEQIKLWDWTNGWFGWKCIQTFEGAAGDLFKVAFNPEDTNGFASCSGDGTVQVWSLDSLKCKHTLLGHSGEVRCLDFFRRDDQQYLITGSYDSSAKIWDMQKMTCVHTMDVIADGILSVMTHPSLPLLIAGTMGGVVHFWSSTDFRCMRILQIGHGNIYSPICLVGLRRVAIGHGFAISMVEIQDEDSK